MPINRHFDVLVIGAGPAGLAAARRAAESGATVAMADDNPSTGGQIWRGPAAEVSQWKSAPVTILTGARVFAAPAPCCLALETFDGEIEIAYRNLILATGARERFLPFPGWTLPNIMGAGGMQAQAKSGLPIRGKNIVIAGSGPLLLAVAKYMHDHGAIVRAIVEQADQSALLRFGFGLARHPGKLMQALRLRTKLFGIPYLTSCWPVSAQGAGIVESVTLRRADQTWSEPCDYLACGFGLIPSTEIAALLGCAINSTGVQADEYQRTSSPAVYAAGEVTGIGGLELSLVEGEIAGYAAAGNQAKAAALFGARDKHRRFASALDKTFALRPELRHLPQDGTVICRCEDVPWSRVRACSGWREAKLHTRCGMGPCQGRVCGGALEFLLGWQPESIRPPVFPARIGSFTAGDRGASA